MFCHIKKNQKSSLKVYLLTIKAIKKVAWQLTFKLQSFQVSTMIYIYIIDFKSMSKHQSVSSVILVNMIDKTSDKTHNLQEFETKLTKQGIAGFWRRLLTVLEIDPLTELEALRILWKISEKDVCITKPLLFKLSTVCLLLAEKLIEDEGHTIQSISLVSGISVNQIAQLEARILSLLDFGLIVTSQDLKIMPRELTTADYLK